MPTTLRFAAGNLRRQVLVAVRQNSLRASLSAQTVAASLITMQLHSAVQLPAPRACRRRRVTRGNTGCGIASLSISIAATACCDSARSPFRRNSRRPPVPAPTRVDAPAARGSGCGHWHRRVPILREQICGNCLNGAPRRAVSFAAPQPELRDAGLPGAQRRDAGSRVAFFGLRFLCEQER